MNNKCIAKLYNLRLMCLLYEANTLKRLPSEDIQEIILLVSKIDELSIKVNECILNVLDKWLDRNLETMNKSVISLIDSKIHNERYN